jgi:hypothetical protein
MTTLGTMDRRSFLRTSAAAGAVLIAVVAGCATEKPQLRNVYDGADLGQERIAIVRSDQMVGMFSERLQWVRFMAVDGKPLNGGWDGEIAILPGPHTLRLRFSQDTSDSMGGLLGSLIGQATEEAVGARGMADLSLEALAGHSYIVKYKAGFMLKENPVSYWIEDQATGAVVAGSKPAP